MGMRGDGVHPMTEHQPEARAVCEHFYASHCYRGMSVRLCMTCHEPDWDDLAGQLADAGRGSELAADPLILSPDEFAAVKTVAAVLGLPGSASEPDGPATEATLTPEAIRELEARFREAVAKRGPLTVLPSDRWQERAEAAEAKLAEVRAAIGNFQAHYGHSAQPSFKVANDLAEGIRQVLDREPLRSGNEEGADRG
jgi:hypothetical protein